MDPHAALARLREGNKRFVAHTVSLETLLSQTQRADHAADQRPKAIILGCSDSRAPAEMIFDQGLGSLFIVRVAGNVVSPVLVGSVEFAAERFGTRLIVVMGHTHCGAIRAAYEGAPEEAIALQAWLKLADEALLPVSPGPEALRRTEQRAVVLQLERLMDYPMVRRAVEAGHLSLHGWHYVIESGEVHVFDAGRGAFVPAMEAGHSGTGPYCPYVEPEEKAFGDD